MVSTQPRAKAATRSEVAKSILLPLGVTALLLLAAYLWRPNLVTSTLTSPAALAFIAGAVLIAVGVRYGITRLTGSAMAGRLAQLVPVGLVLWFVLVPTLFPSTVDEAAPGIPAPAVGAPAAGAPAAGAPAVAATVVGRASFRPLDHDVSGQAALFQVGNERTVRFENFTVESGPDYFVHIVPGAGATRPDGGVELGKLKASKGNQNYAVPAGTPTAGPQTVLIWCRAFQVPVANATLAASP